MGQIIVQLTDMKKSDKHKGHNNRLNNNQENLYKVRIITDQNLKCKTVIKKNSIISK